MRSGTLTVLVILFCPSAFSQTIKVKKVELAGDKIVVYYDLADPNPANEYQVSLYASHNNFAAPLLKVSGNAGIEVSPGEAKKIVWNILEEIGPFDGKLSLEIRGKVFMPVARVDNIKTNSRFKRGKTQEVTWKPGNNNPIQIELMKGGQRVSGELNQPNNGKFALFIPPHVKIGKDYTMKITNSKNPDDVATSIPFAVKRKVPLVLKAIPVLAVAAIIAILSNQSPKATDDKTSSNIPLPSQPE